VEINNHFTARHTPFDEFKQTLFSDWTNDEWNDFDNSMINFCQFYLQKGLINNTSGSIIVKKLRSNTSSEFMEWVEVNLTRNTEHDRKVLLDNFVTCYPNYKNMTTKKFVQWIDTYCRYNNLSLDKDYRRSGNDFFIMIRKNGAETVPDETGF
jgi:hypothetical protein